MSALRPPVIAGRTRGAGTSTIALALHGIDGGVCTGPLGDADVLVADLAAVRRLGVHGPRSAGPRPVLAVVDAIGGATWPAGARGGTGSGVLTRATVLAALGPAAPWFARVVLVPPVPALRAGAFPAPALAGLLSCDPAHLDGPARSLAAALREVADALVAEGRLGRRPATTCPPARRQGTTARGGAPPASAPRPIAQPTRATGSAAPLPVPALVAQPTGAVVWRGHLKPIASRAPVFAAAASTDDEPAPAAPRALALWPGLGPVERHRRAGDPVDHPDLDDDAVEAGHSWRAAG